MRREERGPWYLLTGVILGVIAGLMYAWQVQPTRYVDTDPASLRTDFKDRYRALIAAAYTANGDLVRARARLELLGDPDPYRALAEQAQRTLADGRNPDEARALGLLAVALGRAPAAGSNTAGANTAPATPDLTPAFNSPTPPGTQEGSLTPAEAFNATGEATTRTPTPSRTPLPTRTPTPSQAAPFVLGSQDQVCDRAAGENQIQIKARDSAGEPVSGIEVIAVWEGGEDHFFTGLKPEFGYGYADFEMTPEVVYSVRLAGGGETVSNLNSFECETASGERYWGNWTLEFVQPAPEE